MNTGETAIVAELKSIRLSKTYIKKAKEKGLSTVFDSGYRDTISDFAVHETFLSGSSFFYKLDTSFDLLVISSENVDSLDVEARKIGFSEKSKHLDSVTGQVVDLKGFLSDPPKDILVSILFSFVSSKSGEETRVEYISWFHPDIVKKSNGEKGNNSIYLERSAKFHRVSLGGLTRSSGFNALNPQA